MRTEACVAHDPRVYKVVALLARGWLHRHKVSLHDPNHKPFGVVQSVEVTVSAALVTEPPEAVPKPYSSSTKTSKTTHFEASGGCEGGVDVVGVVAPLIRGGAQVLHGDQIVELSVLLEVQEKEEVGEDDEDQVEVEREEGEVKGEMHMYMDDMTGLRT